MSFVGRPDLAARAAAEKAGAVVIIRVIPCDGSAVIDGDDKGDQMFAKFFACFVLILALPAAA